MWISSNGILIDPDDRKSWLKFHEEAVARRKRIEAEDEASSEKFRLDFIAKYGVEPRSVFRSKEEV